MLLFLIKFIFIIILFIFGNHTSCERVSAASLAAIRHAVLVEKANSNRGNGIEDILVACWQKCQKQSQYSPPAGSSSREEIDLLKRLSELSKSKSVKSGELLKLLRSLALFDKDEVEVEIFVSVVEKTFVPLLKKLHRKRF